IMTAVTPQPKPGPHTIEKVNQAPARKVAAPPPHQLSRKLLRILDRLGCFSFLSAFASIWRMRSRVTENWWPTSSSVWSLFMPMPKRMRIIRSSRGVSEASVRVVVSRRFDWIHAISGTDEKRSRLGRSRHRRLVERRRWRDAEARSSRPVRSPVHHSMPAARLERYRCLRLPRICHPRPEPMASCGRGYSLLVRHALSSLGALALSQRDLAWFCLARGRLPL